MDKLQLFILDILEISAVMILWCRLNKNLKNKLLKNIFIIFLVSISTLLTDSIKFSAILNYSLFIFAVFLLFHKKLVNVITEFCVSSFILIIIELFFALILYIFNAGINKLYIFKNAIVINTGLLISSILIYFCIPIEKLYYKSKFVFKKMNVVILSFLTYVLGTKILWEYNKDIVIQNIFIFIVYFFILNGVNLLIYKMTLKDKEKEMLIETYEKYNKIIENVIHEVRRRQHDFKNHLNTIYGITQVSDEKLLKGKVQNYINSLNYSLESIDNIIQVENSIIAAIIYTKLAQAKDRNIKFVYCVSNNLNFPMSDYELSEVLCNLLDNAFEALDNIQNTEKEVYLTITSDKNKSYIEVKNSETTINPENINKIFKKGFSTKNKQNRGYGLYNVKKIVRNYNGNIQLSFEKNYTVFKILF